MVENTSTIARLANRVIQLSKQVGSQLPKTSVPPPSLAVPLCTLLIQCFNLFSFSRVPLIFRFDCKKLPISFPFIVIHSDDYWHNFHMIFLLYKIWMSYFDKFMNSQEVRKRIINNHNGPEKISC